MSTAIHWTVTDFDRLVATGFFDAGPRRVELVRGEIRTMSPIGPDHASCVDHLTRWSVKAVSDDIVVRVQGPLAIPEQDCELYPDIAWLVSRNYRKEHPQPADVRLVIEVSQATLAYDMGEKRDIYAKARIAEYWVVDVEAKRVHIHRKPSAGGYSEHFTREGNESAVPLVVPGVELSVSGLFG